LSWAAGGVARVAHREKEQPGEAWTGIGEAAADSTWTGAYAATAVDRRCCDAGHVAKETQLKRENSIAACGRTWEDSEASASVRRPSSRMVLRTGIRRWRFECCMNLGGCSRKGDYPD
jgi:hypothetical protein